MRPESPRDFARRKRPEIVRLLEDLVAIDSTTGRESELARFSADWLTRRGIACELRPCLGRFNVRGEVGRGEPALVLSGHLDTVPADGEAWSAPPLRPVIREGRLYGLGASDLKGSIAAAFAACWYLRDRILGGRLVLAMTIEEETTGHGTRALVEEEIARGNLVPPRTAALVTEPTALEHISLGSRGAIFADVTMRGLGGHGSRPEKARNPAEASARVVSALPGLVRDWRRRFPDPDFPQTTATVTSIRSGDPDAHNVIPQAARLVIDVRPVPGLDRDDFAIVKCELRDAIARAAGPGFDVEVDWRFPRPGHKIDPSEDIVAITRSAVREATGRDPALRYTPAGNDACHFGRHGIATVNKIGPGRPDQAHRVDEFVEIDRVLEAVEVYALVASRWIARQTDRSRHRPDAR